MAKQKNAKTQTAPSVKTFPQTEANRKARLERHLRKHPTDAQAQAALTAPLPVRHKPKAKNSTRATAKHVVFVPGEGHKSVPVTLSFNGGAELFARKDMSPKEYEKAVNQKRKPMADVMRESRGQFGSVKPNIFGVEYSRDNVRALCYGIGIKFTGASDRKSAKPARKRKTK
ncbi:hypothetical protein PQE64_gp067 [Salmonella phage vB_STy-RN29]|uniref:hypothetical protein n=1 Tax=Salmonella phage vB_STy-RN29 TaxID=2910950 RepID=UPI00232A432F|nr:hypothetical protein PQE64_gp067 [Salmonella phage vB_STy-RN29]UJD21394.1 hypothetical protein RN29_gp067 [Salmonella phage vB_STy-RN29]